MALASGHTWEDVDPKKKEQYQKVMTGFSNDMIYLRPGDWVVTRNYLKFQEKIYNFKVRYTLPFFSPSSASTYHKYLNLVSLLLAWPFKF